MTEPKELPDEAIIPDETEPLSEEDVKTDPVPEDDPATSPTDPVEGDN